MVAYDALRMPIDGADANNVCASTAAAFGFTSAATKVMEDQTTECIVFQGGPDCARFEVLSGATTLTNISDCDADAVQEVTDMDVNLEDADTEEAVVGNSNALKIADIAAVGNVAFSELTVVSEEECLALCNLSVPECTHVVVEQSGADGTYTCSFHSSPGFGLAVTGATTYFDIVASPEIVARGIGKLSPAKEIVIPAPAPGPEQAGLASTGIDAALFMPPGQCPYGPPKLIPAGGKQNTLKAPDESIELYGDLLGDDGQFPMSYAEIPPVGGTYCTAEGSMAPKITIGGMFMWEGEDGECVAPPATDDGKSCCDVYMWQPNNDGLYYDNCSMKMAIQPDGFFKFETEVPGDESVVGWGADNAPHIHYDIECAGCAGDQNAFNGNTYNYWNKFYQFEPCTDACNNPGVEHESTQVEAGGETALQYIFVLPKNSRN